MKRYVVVGGEAELLLLLHIFPEGVEELDGAFAVYADEPPLGFDVVETSDVEEGWEDEWRSFHHGVRVGKFWVGPPWETIVIDPGRAFGTGAHPTTRLTLELLQTVEPGMFLDIGCGSGVLSIAAFKLGFGPVFAIDVDQAAVEATAANAQVNNAHLGVRRLDALTDRLPNVDVAVANIALDMVERVLPRLQARVAITSGYLDRERPHVAGWEPVDRREADGWAADLLRFTP